MSKVRLNNVHISELIEILSEVSRHCKVINLIVDASRNELTVEPCSTDEIVSIRLTDDNITKLV